MPQLFSRIRHFSRGIDRPYLESRYEELIFLGQPGLDFFVLSGASATIAALGFAMDSPAVIIGAMVISPLLYPIALMGSALSLTHWRRSWALFQSLVLGIGMSIIVAVLFTWVFAPTEYGTEIASRLTASPLLYFLVAFASGVAGTFAYYWPDTLESITGVSIAVALVPPLVMIGIGVGLADTELMAASAKIVGLNVVGLVLAAIVTSRLLWAFTSRKAHDPGQADSRA